MRVNERAGCLAILSHVLDGSSSSSGSSGSDDNENNNDDDDDDDANHNKLQQAYQLGHRQVFLKDGSLERLNAAARKMIADAAEKVQRAARELAKRR